MEFVGTSAEEKLDTKYLRSRIRPFPVPPIDNIEFYPDIFVRALDRGYDIDISQNYPNLLNDELQRKKYDSAINLMSAYPVGYSMSVFIFHPTQVIKQLMERFKVSIVTDYTAINLLNRIDINMIMNSIDNTREFQLSPLSIVFSPDYLLLIKYYSLLQIPIDIRLKTEVKTVNRILYNPVRYGVELYNANTLNDLLKSALNDGRIEEAKRLYREGGRYDYSYDTLTSRYVILALYVEGEYHLNGPDDAFIELINNDMELEYCIRPIFNQFWEEVTHRIATITNPKVIDWMIANNMPILTFTELLDRLSESRKNFDDVSYYLEYCDRIVHSIGEVTHEELLEIIYLMDNDYSNDNLAIAEFVMNLLLDMIRHEMIRITDYYGINKNIDFIINRLNIRHLKTKRANHENDNDEMEID